MSQCAGLQEVTYEDTLRSYLINTASASRAIVPFGILDENLASAAREPAASSHACTKDCATTQGADFFISVAHDLKVL